MPPFRLPFFGPYGDPGAENPRGGQSPSRDLPENSPALDKPKLPGPPVLPRLVRGLDPVSLKLNIIYDASANDRQGILAEQRKKFEKNILPHALAEYADSNVSLDVGYSEGSFDPKSLLGLSPGTVNVFVSDRTSTGDPGVSGRASNGAFVSVLNINTADGGTLGDELAHHILGDTFGLADSFRRFMGKIDPALGKMAGHTFNAVFDIRNDLLRAGRLRYNKGTGGLMPISDFNRGARRLNERLRK